MLVITAVSIVLILLLIIGVCAYFLKLDVGDIDKSDSPDGKYTLTMQMIGEPVLFGSADGRLVLKEGKEKRAECRFTLADDGMSIVPGCWQVRWYDDRVEAIISGSEQRDEQIVIYFNGKTEKAYLDPDTGEPLPPSEERDTEEARLEMEKQEQERQQKEREEFEKTQQPIIKGYEAVHDFIIKEGFDGAVPGVFDSGGAEAHGGDSLYILAEDKSFIEFLQYNRESTNGKCGLYVRYKCAKERDSTWDLSSAEIIDMYAYQRSTGKVVAGGKTDWTTSGSEEYTELTGEN